MSIISETVIPETKELINNSKSIKDDFKYYKVKHKIPNITIFGLGGCGTNLTQKFYQLNLFNNSKLKYQLIDTSYSNYNDKLKLPINVINKGNIGSGKFRQENYNIINTYIKEYTSSIKNKLSDINILIFSSSGGTGSIIGPIFINELLKMNKRLIIITLVNDQSEIDLINSLNTLKSLVNISKSSYIPIGLFKNITRDITDKNILNLLEYLITILLSEGLEIDYMDKINFLNPSKVINTIPGLHIIYGINSEDNEKNTEEYIRNKYKKGIILPNDILLLDSLFILSKDYNNNKIIPKVKLFYHGIDNKIKYEYIACGITNDLIPQRFIDDLSSKLENYKLKNYKELNINTNGYEDDNGIVI